MSDSLLSLKNLSIAYRNRRDWQRVTHNISLEMKPGQSLALVGESGSGKTTTAQAIIGLLPANARIETGQIRLNGQNIVGWSEKRLRALRGKIVSLIPQDPANSLDPLMRVGDQIGEMFKIHQGLRGKAVKTKVLELIEQVGIHAPESRARQYPHQLSGGMKQRVLIAMAIAIRPKIIIADEPTSALDATVQKRILELIDHLRHVHGTALLMVTHDLGVASDRADTIIVMNKGRVEEEGSRDHVLSRPKSAYTSQLLANDPTLSPPKIKPLSQSKDDIIRVENLTVDYRGSHPFRAVDNVSFCVKRGTTHAIVGESGSGKTSTIRALCRFVEPKEGQIFLNGRNIIPLRGETLRQLRRSIQLVYQNPFGSLDPRQTIGEIIAEPLLNYRDGGFASRHEREFRVASLLDEVELARDVITRRPVALSGGQRQRVAIARALVLEPEILVLDEAVSALDVTVQAQILHLLERLQREKGLSYVFVSHDLALVRKIADTVSVMKDGHQVEQGGCEQIFTQPTHHYTKALIAAIPGRRHAVKQAYGSSQL